MLKRKLFLDKKIIKYKIWHNSRINNILQSSFRQNHFLKPSYRISFFINKDRQTQHYMFYKSQSKLQCFISYSVKVPNKKLNLSRFYLGRATDRLLLANYQK